MSRPILLSIVEIGGYPNFRPLYEQAGFEVLLETRMRKAMGTYGGVIAANPTL